MLRKLLKYDLKSIINYWLIGALISVTLSVAGGFCIKLLTSERKMPTAVYVICSIAAFIAVIGFVIFTAFSVIIVYVRFYKNFFTDEGYLTFTLPVKRSDLINSKLLTAMIVEFITGVVAVVDVFAFLLIGMFDKEIIDAIKNFFAELWELIIENFDIYMLIYAVEIVVFAFLSVMTSILLICLCITVGSIITKKGKILVTVILYYIVNSAISTLYQLVFFFGSNNASRWFSIITEHDIKPVLASVGLLVIAFIGCVCIILYSLQYKLLDKKLNLA